MGPGAGEFPRIVDNLRALAAGQVTKKPISVSITLVVTQQNIHEIPAFIELGNEIKAATIYVYAVAAARAGVRLQLSRPPALPAS